MKLKDVLAACIDDVVAGHSTVEDCLDRYPRFRAELRPLLQLAARVEPVGEPPSDAFKRRARLRLLNVMASTPQVSPRRFRVLFPARRFSFTTATAVAAAVILVAGTTTVLAAQGSLPNDFLYPVKTSVESLRLAFTWSPTARADYHIQLARDRAAELAEMSRRGRNIDPATLEAAIDQLDRAVTEIAGLAPPYIAGRLEHLAEATAGSQTLLAQALLAAHETGRRPLETALDALQRGAMIAEVAETSPTFLDEPPSVLDSQLDDAYFEIEGTVVSVSDDAWNVGGLPIDDLAPTDESLEEGSRVRVEGIGGDSVFIGSVETGVPDGNQASIEGTFWGISPDDATWYVSGIPVDSPEETPPEEGDRLLVSGVTEDGAFVVTEVSVSPVETSEVTEPHVEDEDDGDKSDDEHDGDKSDDEHDGDKSDDEHDGDKSHDEHDGDSESDDEHDGDKSDDDEHDGDKSHDEHDDDDESDHDEEHDD